jgi:DNA-binding MarR family transcriptional regulator
MTPADLAAILASASRRGLSTSIVATLAHIAAVPGTKLAELCEILGVTSAAVTGIADRMADQGLATREAVNGDLRAHALEITAHGRRILKSILSQTNNNTNTKATA